MENKRKNVYITIFVITTIVAACAAVYFGVMKNRDEEKINNLKSKIEEMNSKIQISQSETEKENESVRGSEKNIEIIPFNKLNIITDRNKENMYIARSSRGMIVTLNNEGKVEFRFVAPDIKELYPDLDSQFISTKYEFVGISDDVVDIQAVPLDSYSEDTVILFLLRNNTVEYITLSDICKNKSFDNVKKIDGLNNTINIDIFNYFVPSSEGLSVPVAITSDGNIYDLYNKIKNN